MYVFKYINKGTGQFIGYHASTSCQTTQDLNHAKRYSCEEPTSQMETISGNLKSVLSKTEEDSNKDGLVGIFGSLGWAVKNNYFKDLEFDNILIEPQLVEDVEIKHKVSAIINQSGVTKVDMSLEEAIVSMVKDKDGAHPRD